jgi:hypothetical protein
MKGAAFADLRGFASDLHDAVVADALKRNAPRVNALLSLHDLSAVTVESNGCYGPCGVYTLTFAKDRRRRDRVEQATRALEQRAVCRTLARSRELGCGRSRAARKPRRG